jgi:hypothetical protein
MIEIGKRDIMGKGMLSMNEFLHNRAFISPGTFCLLVAATCRLTRGTLTAGLSLAFLWRFVPELLHASWQCVAPYGTMIEIGKRDIMGKGMLSMNDSWSPRPVA